MIRSSNLERNSIASIVSHSIKKANLNIRRWNKWNPTA